MTLVIYSSENGIKPAIGQKWQNLSTKASDEVKSITSFGRVTWLDHGSISAALLHSHWIFTPTTDIEWFAVNVTTWPNESTYLCKDSDSGYSIKTRHQQRDKSKLWRSKLEWQLTRCKLGLDAKLRYRWSYAAEKWELKQ